MKLNYKTQQTHIYFFYSKTLFFKIQIYAYQNSIFGVHVLQISNLYNWICDDVSPMNLSLQEAHSKSRIHLSYIHEN